MGIFDNITKLGLPLTEDTADSVELEEQEKEKRIKGRIIQLDSRGFGFIISDELPFERIFFHWTSLAQGTKKFPELERGMFCTFLPRMQTPKEKGYKAIRIVIEE